MIVICVMFLADNVALYELCLTPWGKYSCCLQWSFESSCNEAIFYVR